MSRAQETSPGTKKSTAFSLAIVLLGSSACLHGQTASVPSHTSQDKSSWILSTSQFDNAFEKEPVVGNGLLGLRIPAAGMGYLPGLGTIGWPLGTERIASAIAAGVYAKVSDSAFYKEPKEAIALIPNWSTLTFADPSGAYSPATASAENIAGYHQQLDLHTGTVTTSGVWTSPGRNKTHFTYRVLADRAHGHRAVVVLELTPQWNGTATVGSVLDGTGARRLDPVSSNFDGEHHLASLTYKTKGSGMPIQLAEAATLSSSCKFTDTAGTPLPEGTAAELVTFQAQTGKTCTFIKYVGVVTSRDSKNPQDEARSESQQASKDGLASLENENRAAWDEIWKADIEVEGDPALQRAIRANEYTLFSSIAPNSPMSLGPSGLTSDGYAGMVFWDADTWMFPALLAQHPKLARVMADYRSDTLPAAKKNAADNGYAGVLYPWTSGLTGDMGDECYGSVTNEQGKVIADPNKSCTQQLHLQSDIAFAQSRYYEATGDKEWLAQKGWPVLEAVAQFWVSKVKKSADGYAIDTVQTPDEYATDTDNDAYTNASASLALNAAIQAAGILGKPAPPEWAEISAGLIKTMEIDTEHDVYREHEGYTGQKIKQADVVMLTYPLDFSMPKAMAVDDLNYYTPRTDVDGPAMTDAIHSIAAATVDAPGCSAFTYMVRSYAPFVREPFQQFSEFAPIRLKVTSYDFLTGVGGFMQEFQYGFSGFRPQVDAVRLDPNLPPQLAGITLRNLVWQGRVFTLHIGPRDSTVTLNSGEVMTVITPAGKKTVSVKAPLTLPTRRSDLQPTPDLVRCHPARASSSEPASPAVAAVDGIPATSWVASEAKATLNINLERTVAIAKVTIQRGSRDPFPYDVELSADGTHWKVVAHAAATASGSDAGTDELTFAPTPAKYLRLTFAGGDQAKPPNIAEVQAFSRAD